jgi:hypothetical protein
MKTALFLISLTAISFILVAQKNYPKIYINSSITQMGTNGKRETLNHFTVLNQGAFRISLTLQLTGKYHAVYKEMITTSKMKTITIVDNRMMDMNFNSSQKFLRWINSHGYEEKYSDGAGSTMNFAFEKIL